MGAQVLLAAAFLAHGLLFLFPPAAMVEQMNAALPRAFQLFIGVAEVLAAVGLTLPGVTRIQPCGWCPSRGRRFDDRNDQCHDFHIARGEVSSAITTAVLLLVATFVAYMRWRVLPIRPRTRRRAEVGGPEGRPLSHDIMTPCACRVLAVVSLAGAGDACAPEQRCGSQPAPRRNCSSPRRSSPQTVAFRFRVEVVANGLEIPWSLVFAPDGRLFVPEAWHWAACRSSIPRAARPGFALTLDDAVHGRRSGSAWPGAGSHSRRTGSYISTTPPALQAARGPIASCGHRESGGRLAEQVVLLDNIPASFLHPRRWRVTVRT